MNCDGSGWIGVGVGRETYAQKCHGCSKCKPSEFSSEETSGSACPWCGAWFPYPVGTRHQCLAGLRTEPLPGTDPPDIDISGLSV